MKSNHTEPPRRIRYTRKSTERADRQAASHAQQIEEMDRRWEPIDSSLLFQDSHTGTTFDRPKFQKLIRICEENQRPREDPGRIEMYAPSRFGRILDKSGKPDIGAYMSQYLALKSLGWNLEFITVALSGVEMADLTLIVVHACQSAEFSGDGSRARGVDEITAQKVFQQVTAFSEFGFPSPMLPPSACSPTNPPGFATTTARNTTWRSSTTNRWASIPWTLWAGTPVVTVSGSACPT